MWLNKKILAMLLILLGLLVTMGSNIKAIAAPPTTPYYYYAVGGEVEVPKVGAPSVLLVLAGVAAVVALTLLVHRK